MKNKKIDRHFKPPKNQSFFLFGPRGTGKSQFLKATYPNCKVLDFLDEATQLKFLTRPESLEPVVMAMKNRDILVADEIQKVPNLLSKIHQIMEDDSYPKVQFILTGSSARKLKSAGIDLLAGRALSKQMHPFLASELGSKFNLNTSLEIGLIPVVWSSESPLETLKSYIALYIKEEVKQERLVQNIAAFSRFLEALSFSHGEILNLSNVARDCESKRSTVDGYLEILEDLLLGYRISPFKKKNRKATVNSDKFYYFDCGVFKSLRAVGPLDDSAAVQGPALEGLVLQNLRAWASYQNKGVEIFFWRTEAKSEVDFIVYGENIFWAIEVKSSKKISPKDFSGLHSFSEDYPQAKCFFLYRGAHAEKHGAIHCLPVEDFLLKNLVV